MPRKSNTRAASGAGSIRQRPDGRWEARVTVGFKPRDRKANSPQYIRGYTSGGAERDDGCSA